MNHTRHSSCNGALGAPADWDHGQLPCDAIAITRRYVEGVPVVSTFWRPSPDELEALNAGGLVMLSVCGYTMPPVMVETVAPEPEQAAH